MAKKKAKKSSRKPARKIPSRAKAKAGRTPSEKSGRPAAETPSTAPRVARRRQSERVKSKTVLHRGPRIPEVKAVGSEKSLTSSEINKFRELLLQRREDLVAIVSRKKEQELQVEEPEIGDEADIATRSVEKDILFELTDSEKQTLEMVESALRRIDKGVFGRCEYCQRPVGRLRLDVMPWARYCIQCQARQETPLSENV